MDKKQIIVRKAKEEDVEFIVALIDRVQKKLTDSGSLQQIGPISYATVENYCRNGYAHILVASGRRVCSVFVEAVTVENFPLLETLGLANRKYFFWYLRTLAIEPSEQGHGLGYNFLEGIKSYIHTQPQPALIVLDCWAGNATLRTFYTRAGFQLHGIYPEGDFQVAVFTLTLS